MQDILCDIDRVIGEEFYYDQYIAPWNVVKCNDKRIIRTNAIFTSLRIIFIDNGYIFKKCGDVDIIEKNLILDIKYSLGKWKSMSYPFVSINTVGGNVFRINFLNYSRYRGCVNKIIESINIQNDSIKTIDLGPRWNVVRLVT